MNALWLLCILSVLPGQRTSEQASSDFRSANERALEGDLEGAIGLYHTILDGGIDDADVYYNLGNAYAQAGKPIDAIVSYERALRLSPGDAEIADNLRLVRKTLAGEQKEEPAASLTAADAIEPVVAPLSPVVFGWIAVAADVLLFFAWFLRRRSDSKRLTRALGLSMALSIGALLVSVAVVGGHWIVARDPRAVIVDKVELREGPHAKFKSKGRARYGGRVRVLDRAEGFVEVLEQDGTSGWVPATAIQSV